MLNTYRASQRNYPSGIYQEQIHIIFYDHFGQSKFSFHSVMYPGMIVSISHSRILGLSFSFPSRSWISGMDFFVPLLCPFVNVFFFATCFRTLGMELCTPVPELLKVIPARPWCEWLVLILFLPLHPPLFPIPKMFRIRAKTDFSFHIFRCHIPSTNVKGGDF